MTFKIQKKIGVDLLNDPIYEYDEITVEDCLIAPISEPSNAREQQAMEQNREQVRIHLPKAFTGDVSNSDFIWLGKRFHVDSDSVAFMDVNTPTRWNRYFRAERVNG